MEEKEAGEIHRHALRAVKAVDDLSESIQRLSFEERPRFGRYLGEVVEALHFGILSRLYEQYPLLRPAEERPVVSSYLEWQHVHLPEGLTSAELDSLIFSVLTPRWQKTAMVIGRTCDLLKAGDKSLPDEAVGARLNALAAAGKIDFQGDVRKWRHSEVRLNPLL